MLQCLLFEAWFAAAKSQQTIYENLHTLTGDFNMNVERVPDRFITHEMVSNMSDKTQYSDEDLSD